MINILIVVILLAVLGGAGVYIYRAKKRGAKCVGCPHAGSCGSQCGCCHGACFQK